MWLVTREAQVFVVILDQRTTEVQYRIIGIQFLTGFLVWVCSYRKCQERKRQLRYETVCVRQIARKRDVELAVGNPCVASSVACIVGTKLTQSFVLTRSCVGGALVRVLIGFV
jgi:hypothetical protein